MGAGLAAQRGWPQREDSGHDTVEISEDEKNIGLGASQEEPLNGWRNVASSISFGALEVGDVDGFSISGGNVNEHVDSGVAYGMGSLSTEEEIRQKFRYQPAESWSAEKQIRKVRSKLSKLSRGGALMHFLLPITKVGGNYSMEKLTRDVVVGTTMATLMIPQGMAFATVAGVPLVYGLYIVWAPPFIQSLYGMSLHVSYGPFALIGLLMRNSLGMKDFQACDGICRDMSGETQEYLEACTLVSFFAGICFFLMALFNLGKPLSILLADPVISGFVTASAILVGNSQVCSFLQIQHSGHSGVYGTLMHAWDSREDINWSSVTIGVVSMILYFTFRHCNHVLKSRGVTGFFLPEALLVVVIATAVSWLGDMEGHYGVSIVGHIPAGLPPFTPPRFNKGEGSLLYMMDMAGVALTAAIVSFIITMSIAKSLAGAKEIKPTRQLVAFGFANLVGSFFKCLPCCASLSRAAIIDALDARTVLHNVFTFALMTMVLLYISPVLEYLPISVLAASIFAVIWKFLDFREPWRLYHISTPDLLMWLATFSVTLVLSVRAGIVVGMGVSALTLIQSSSQPMVINMGNLPGTDYYRDLQTYPEAVKIPGIEILRFGSSLNFANKDVFRRAVIKLVEKSDQVATISASMDSTHPTPLQYIILDSSSIHSLDFSSMRMLEGLVALLLDHSPPIEMLLAPVSDPMMTQVVKSPVLRATLGRRYFLSIPTAVNHAQDRVNGGLLMAPTFAFQTVLSKASLSMLDENQINDF